MVRLTPVPLVAFDHVSFSYDGATPALADVSLSVSRGETVALVGPNGCGKSTALRLLAGLSFAEAGEVRYDGDVINERSMARQDYAKRLHQRVGYVFQDADGQLFCPSVQEELAFGPRQMGLATSEIERRVDDVARAAGLGNLLARAPYTLSGGEKRRVAIACVLTMNPETLLLDEPAANLDEDGQAWLLGLLSALCTAGKTIVLTTHHAELARALGARIIAMDKHHHVMDDGHYAIGGNPR